MSLNMFVFLSGCFVGSFVTWMVMTLCDHHQYRHMIERYRKHLQKQRDIREKKLKGKTR